MVRVIACVGIVLALTAALGATAAIVQDEKVVQITDRGFVPPKIEVTVGQKVMWENSSLKEHTVTARDKVPGVAGQEDKPLFDSGPIKPGGSWARSFSKEGTYEYGCRMDKTMTGTIVVKAIK